MTKTKQLRENVKTHYFNLVREMFETIGEQTLQTASNEFAIPVVDAEGGEHYVVIKIVIPTGSRDGESYDAYAVAEDYQMRCKAKEEKAKAKSLKVTK